MSEAWPRRNLGRAEHWGRTVEKRVDGLSAVSARQDQSQDGLGRFSASTADALLQNAETLTNAINSTPRYFAVASGSSGFGFGAGWLTVASRTITNPGGYTRAEVSATGVLASYQDAVVSGRKFIWPFSLDYVTSEFGPRPPLPFHNGIDFAYSGITGAPIPATHDGTIILRGYYSDWGNYTRIDCSAQTGIAGSWTGYAHMNAPGLYGVGTAVSQGQTIGYVGSTGYVTGPHLHYETATSNYDAIERINPRDFMDIFGGTTVSLTAVQARIVVNGVSSPTFQPYTEMGLSQSQLNYPVFGTSITGGGKVTVELQVRASTAIAPSARNIAQLSVIGGFQYV